MCEIDWSALAAWAQAVFSVLAIVAAIWIARKSANESRQLVIDERKRQADIVASRLAMQLGLFAQQLEARASRIELMEGKAKSGQIFQQDMLRALFLPNETEWIADLRPNALIFDRDSGIRVQTIFDLIEGAKQKIETNILMHGVLESTPEETLKTLKEIKGILASLASECRDVEEHLEESHQLNEDKA